MHLCLIANTVISYCPLHSPIKVVQKDGQVLFPSFAKFKYKLRQKNLRIFFS